MCKKRKGNHAPVFVRCARWGGVVRDGCDGGWVGVCVCVCGCVCVLCVGMLTRLV